MSAVGWSFLDIKYSLIDSLCRLYLIIFIILPFQITVIITIIRDFDKNVKLFKEFSQKQASLSLCQKVEGLLALLPSG